MKTLLLLLIAVAGTGVFLRWNDLQRSSAAKTPTAAPVVASNDPWERAADAQPRPATRPGQTATWDPGLRRYIVHESNVSARVSAGLNATAPPLPTPKPRTLLDQPAHR